MIDPIVRQITIDMITGEYNPIIEWFDSIWENITIYEREFQGDVIYHDKIKTCLFKEYDDRFLCDYDLYWHRLHTKFDLNIGQEQAITKLLVESKLNKDIPVPEYKIALYLTIIV